MPFSGIIWGTLFSIPLWIFIIAFTKLIIQLVALLAARAARRARMGAARQSATRRHRRRLAAGLARLPQLARRRPVDSIVMGEPIIDSDPLDCACTRSGRRTELVDTEAGLCRYGWLVGLISGICIYRY